MKKSIVLLSAISVSAIVFSLGCATSRSAEHADQHQAAWSKVGQAIAVLNPTAGSQTKGVIRFVQTGDSVKVTAMVEGLQPNQKHAIHIHEFGDCSAADGTSAGSHYNPQGHSHGLPRAEQRHAGDLGNLQADAQGKAHYEITVNNISVAGLKNPIIGRGVIVHAKQDDGGQPVGNAGGRIACGVIGVAKQ